MPNGEVQLVPESVVGAGPGKAVRPLCRLFDEYFSFAVTFTAKFEALSLNL